MWFLKHLVYMLHLPLIICYLTYSFIVLLSIKSITKPTLKTMKQPMAEIITESHPD